MDEAEKNPDEVVAPVQMSAVEEAAMKFTKLLPYVTKFANSMPSKGGLVRVLFAFAEFPLGAQKPRLLSESERQLFQVLQEIQGFKSTILLDFMKKMKENESALEKVNENVPNVPEEQISN